MMASILILVLSLPSFAGIEGPDIPDFYGPLPYDGKPVDKMMIGISTYKDMDSSSSNLFDSNFIQFYMPIVPADLRVDIFLPKGSDSKYLQLGTVIPMGIASIKGSFMTKVGGTSTGNEINIDVIFGGMLFNWGLGISNISGGGSSNTYPSLKIAKDVDLWAMKLEGKVAITKIDPDTETDITVKVRPGAFPIYAGIGYSMFGSNNITMFLLGALFSL